MLVDAFGRFASRKEGEGWRLRIVGPHEEALGGGGASYLEELKRRASGFASRVEWPGFVREPADLKRHLLSAGLFVYPSVDEFGESFGVAALEAMACGCPTIVSALDCFRDFLEDGVTGYMFDHRSAAAADELAALLERVAVNPEARRQCALRGWEASQRFQLQTVAGEFLSEFEAVCRGV